MKYGRVGSLVPWSPVFQVRVFNELVLYNYKFRLKTFRILNLPEVLNVHMNKIYKKLTAIKLNKLKFKKVFKKITFSFSKVNFSLLEKKILLKKVIF